MALTLQCAGGAMLTSAYFVLTVSRKNIPVDDLPPLWQCGLSGVTSVGGITDWVAAAEPPPAPTLGNWNPATTYSTGDRVASIHHSIRTASGTLIYPLTYQSLQNGNVGHDPDNWDGWWTCIVQVPNVVGSDFVTTSFAYALSPLPTKATLATAQWQAGLGHSLFWNTLQPGDVVQLLDAYIVLNYLAGAEIVRVLSRPLGHSATTGSQGLIANPGINAQFQCWHTSGLSDTPFLTLNSFEPKIVDGLQPNGTVGAAYLSAIVASGGVTPYAYGIIAGGLPPGITLDPATGVISGTPVASGIFEFTAQVTDSTGATAQTTCAAQIGCGGGEGPCAPGVVAYQEIHFPEVDSIPDGNWGGFSTSLPGVNYGPWRSGDAMYVLMITNGLSSPNMFRSLDKGRTWERVGGSANPHPQDESESYVACDAWFDAAANVIHTLSTYTKPSASILGLSFKDFDIATNSWGTVYATNGPNANTGGAWGTGLIVKADGDRVAIFAGLNASVDHRLYYSKWNAGSGWSAPVLLDSISPSNVTDRFRGAVLDAASQNIHVIWESPLGFDGPFNFYHRVIQSNYTLGPITLLDTMTSSSPRIDVAKGQGLNLFNGKLYVWFIRGTAYNVKVGNSASLPTAFTETFLADVPTPDYSPTDDNNQCDMIGVVKADEGKLVFLYLWENGEGSSDSTSLQAQQMYKIESTDGATWTEPELFFSFWPLWTPMSTFSVNDMSDDDYNVGGIAICGEFSSEALAFYMRRSQDCTPGEVTAIGNRFY